MKKNAKTISKIIMIFGCTFLLSGCTKSNIVTPDGGITSQAVPDLSTREKGEIVIDWSEVGNSLDERFLNEKEYSLGDSINYSIDPEQKVAQLTVLVKDDADPNEAAAYAEEVLKGMNDEVATQDFNYKLSGDEYYGGFFEEYPVQVLVYPVSSYFEEDKCIVDMFIPAGEYKKIVPGVEQRDKADTEEQKSN